MSQSKKFLIFLVLIGTLVLESFPLESSSQERKINLLQNQQILNGSLLISQNSLLPISSLPKLKVVKRIKMIVTGYSSSPSETDDDPHITAAGTPVKPGIVANNLLSFGTKLKIPELYGDKVFVVEDRMNRKKGYYHIDIWFPSRQEALKFGTDIVWVEILES